MSVCVYECMWLCMSSLCIYSLFNNSHWKVIGQNEQKQEQMKSFSEKDDRRYTWYTQYRICAESTESSESTESTEIKESKKSTESTECTEFLMRNLMQHFDEIC